MWDAPTPLGPVLAEYAVLIALALVAGRLDRASTLIRWGGRVLLGLVALASIKSTEIFQRWGILADQNNRTPFSVETTWAILLGLNLLVLVAWLAGKSRRSYFRQGVA